MEAAGSTEYDVAIVGGGPAGLSAALVLGRMRRRVLVCDTGRPANAVSHGVGGLLTRDGTPPAELRAIAREEVARYPTVEFRDAEVTAARALDPGFELETSGGRVAARKLLLTHGLDYRRPDVPGLGELWGERVFHCPYCHGWEVRDLRVAVLATTPRVAHQTLLLRSLTEDLVVLENGSGEPDAEGRAGLERAGVEILPGPVARVEGDGAAIAIQLEGREPLVRDALFIQPDLTQACDLALELGAELSGPALVATDPTGATDVPGLRVAGDAANAPQSVAVAIGSGSAAAAMLNAELAIEDAGAG